MGSADRDLLPGHGKRLTSIFFADICGYSRLMERNEVGTIEAVKELFGQVVEPLVSAHRGRVIQVMGDGVFAEFASPIDAVTCSVELQTELAKRNSRLPNDGRILLRIGINVGEVVVLDNLIHGTGVNIAARLQAIASEGGISVSRSVYEQARDKTPYEFHRIGKINLKNISKPVEVYSLELPQGNSTGSKEIVATTSYESSLSKPSIAVLPFENLTGDDELQLICAGVTEGLRCNLGKFKELLIVARQTANDLHARVIAEEVPLALGHTDLGQAFARLEPELQAVLAATALDGLTNAEAATLLGIPAGTVKSRLSRARTLLKDVLT